MRITTAATNGTIAVAFEPNNSEKTEGAVKKGTRSSQKKKTNITRLHTYSYTPGIYVHIYYIYIDQLLSTAVEGCTGACEGPADSSSELVSSMTRRRDAGRLLTASTGSSSSSSYSYIPGKYI